MLCDLAISLPGVHPTDAVLYVHKKSWTRIFTALFIKLQTVNHLIGYINDRIKENNNEFWKNSCSGITWIH